MLAARAEPRRPGGVDRTRLLGRLRAPGAGALLASALALAVTVALVGPQVVLHPGRGIVGSNPASDYQIMTWSLAWWPWAVGHGVDPLHTSLLWPPHGFSTLWMTTIPVPALLGLPLTLTAGPLVAYNVLAIAAIALAAAAAYLLCFELTARVAPSLLGAGIFALSPYLLGHTLSEHLDLTFVFPLPLLALLAVRRLRGKTSPRRFVAGWAVLLLALASSSLELFLDLTVLLVLVAPLALLVERAHRRELLRLSSLVAVAYAACLPVLVPVAALALSQPHGAVASSPSGYSVDLVNLLVPTPTVLAGLLAPARAVSSHFVGNIGERDGYVGLPLLAAAALGLRAHRRRGARVAGLLVALAVVLSLGPTLAAGGRPLLTWPFALSRLPLVGDTLPARLSLFATLGLASLAALWFAQPGPRLPRLGLAGLVVASLLPNPALPARTAAGWPAPERLAWSTPRLPAGFVDARSWRRVVPQGTTVLVVPTRDRTAAQYWQTETGMAFRLAIPETPFVPPPLAADPTVAGLADGNLPEIDGVALAAARVRSYLAAAGVGAVVTTPRTGQLWLAIVRRAVPARPVRLGGSLVFRVPRTLPPARATGEVAVAGSLRALTGASLAAPTVRAWLEYDGARAHLRVRLGAGRTRTLSARGADAEAPTAAVGPAGRAAVLFLEWRDGELRLRAATASAGRWSLATLDRGAHPIWSPQVALLPDGTAIAAWIDGNGAGRMLWSARFEPRRGWQRPIALDAGDGLAGLRLQAAGRLVVVAWHDSLAAESRVRAATYARGTWRSALLASSLRPLEGISVDPLRAGWVGWSAARVDRRPLRFHVDRRGTGWGRPRDGAGG